ncbi:H-NS family nucleoid-associated regulatory protein [Falsirhodobacter algicola]|uniref:H-NS histone family protein n=1 Tax=Falsirhodobacter algicola TaxID=2692330 RepID=A0A8J8MTZ6_9RHOB|nr:H-NS histone family protein [Falsirhodobacter algicola]QUS36409.1 H-NS histone family protein [Falsirhodobacter algicola]
MNLDELTLKELKDLRAKVDRAIESFEDRRKREAVAALEAQARELGFSLGELTAASQTRKRGAATPKYVNPQDSSQTWTGRGRKPRWYLDALQAGTSPEDMEI